VGEGGLSRSRGSTERWRGFKCFTHLSADSITKPTKPFEKGRRRDRGKGNIMEGWSCSKYTVRMYGIITMLIIINN
jgi:hypothetical protein